MNKITPFIAFLFVASVLFQSCTIEKRRYMPGWHISANKQNRSASPSESTNSIESKNSTLETNQPIGQVESQLEESFEVNSARPNSESNLAKYFQATSIENESPHAVGSKRKKDIGSSISKYTQKTNREAREPMDGEKEPWTPKMWGVILGILLALIALPVLFFVVFILFDGEADDLEIQESSEDSSFKNAFKRVFNKVTRVGFSVLFVALLILLLGALVVFLYLELGVLGIILGILVLFLFAMLWIFISEKFLKYILPNYKSN